MNKINLVLASTSPYRKQLLEKLHIPFTTFAPNIDETPLQDEAPDGLVQRLAESKAKTYQTDTVNTWVIGSDQVAVFNNQILGKPGSIDNATKQLSQFSGNTVTFLTGLCIYQPSTGKYLSAVEPFSVKFKALKTTDIEQYVAVEQPLDCAGSFKSEGLGIMLFEALQGRDPNSLIGLPLIKLSELFNEVEINLLAQTKQTEVSQNC